MFSSNYGSISQRTIKYVISKKHYNLEIKVRITKSHRNCYHLMWFPISLLTNFVYTGKPS